MERQLGTTFRHEKVKCRVELHDNPNNCEGCVGEMDWFCRADANLGKCTRIERTDKKDVIFKPIPKYDMVCSFTWLGIIAWTCIIIYLIYELIW